MQLILNRICLNTYRLVSQLDYELLANDVPRDEVKADRRKFLYKIDNVISELTVSKRDIRVFVTNVKSYQEAFEYLKLSSKAKEFKLEQYFNFNQILKLLLKNKSPDFYYKLAKFYKNFNLDENNQGDFKKLIGYVDINEGDLELIVDTLIYTKNAGCPLSQKDIVKYYDSNRPHSENLNSLREAWIFAHEHEIPVKIMDFIQAIKYERDPHIYVVNYNKIISNDLPIPYEKFKIFNVPQPKIGEFISLMIKSKIAEIYLDFETLYDDMKLGRDVWSVMRYLIKFHDSGFDSVNYASLRNFRVFDGELDKLHEAFLYNRKRKIIDEKVLFNRILEILLVKNEDLNFNSYTCIKAIELAYLQVEAEQIDLGLEPLSKEEIANEVFNDYLAGVDVYEVVNYIKYAKEHDVFISYNTAKLINQTKVISFKEAIFNALNPVLLKDFVKNKDEEGHELLETKKLRVTTKDNIEILVDMMIEAVLLPNNYFKGSDETILFQRASAIIIDEIQRKYNHDEIIVNIENISKNVLYRLMEETRNVDIEYVEEAQMKRVQLLGHGEHSENHNTHEEKTDLHKVEHSEKRNVHSEKHHIVKSDNNRIKFITVSKYKPLKVIIPRIDFVKETFKEFEKTKEEFEHHKHQMVADLKRLEAEIEIKKAWAKDDNVKYKFLDSDDGFTFLGNLKHGGGEH